MTLKEVWGHVVRFLSWRHRAAPHLRENILRQPGSLNRVDAALDHLLQEKRLPVSGYLGQ